MTAATRICALTFLGVMLAFGTCRAQEINAVAQVDSFTYRIGDWIHARVTINADWNCRVAFPMDTSLVQGAEIVSAEPEVVKEDGGRRIVTKNFVLASFDTGQVSLVFTIPWHAGDDTTRYIATTTPIFLTITAPNVDTTKTFRDIKEVLHVSLTIWDYLLYLAIALVVAGVAWWSYRRYRRRKRRAPPPVVVAAEPPPPPADVVALERLHKLEEGRLWQHGMHKQFESELTDILREYVERKLAIPALEETTREIVAALAVHGLEMELIGSLEEILVRADRTKFAKYVPSTMEHEASQRFGYEFVERTRELPDPSEALAPRIPAVPAGADEADEEQHEAGDV